MTQLSPTALEEAAKALYREFENRPLYAQTQMNGVIANECATAAIMAYLAQREKEGFVEVPKEPTDAMLPAGRDAVQPFLPGGRVAKPVTDQYQIGREVWRAMIAAAEDSNDQK